MTVPRITLPQHRLVNFSHPLAPLFYMPCNDSGGSTVRTSYRSGSVIPTIQGTVGRGTYKFGNAASMGGTSDYINLVAGTRILPSATTPFTIAWAQRSAINSSTAPGVFALTSGGSTNAFLGTWFSGSGGLLNFFVGEGGNASVHFTAVPDIAAGDFRRMVLVGRGGTSSTTAADYDLYKDGLLYAGSAGNTLTALGAFNYFGWDGTDAKWNGLLGELAVWDHALNPNDVANYFADSYIFCRQRRVLFFGQTSAPSGGMKFHPGMEGMSSRSDMTGNLRA